MPASSLVLYQESRPNAARSVRRAPARSLTPPASRNGCAEPAQIIPFKRARSQEIDTYEYLVEFNAALKADVSGLRHATKIVAEAGNANVRTADNWIKMQCVPNSLQLFRIASTQGFEHVRAFALRMMAAEGALDAPRVQKLLRDLYVVVGDQQWPSAEIQERNAAGEAAE